MKKIIALLLVFCALFSLTACGGSKTTTDKPADKAEGPVAPSGYGKRDITLVVPLTAGGAFDQAARKLSAIINEKYGLNIVVQNVEGGGGLTGMTQVITSKPDGYTLAFYSVGFLGNIVLGRNDLTLDSVIPLCRITEESQMICVNSSSPIQTFDELVAEIKANPGKITMATPGSLNSQQVGVRALSEMLFGPGQYEGIVHVPYAGGARITADLIGESIIDSGILKSSEIASAYAAGQVRPLVVVGPERMTLCPDVPTMTEAGYDFLPYYSGLLNSTCIYAPAGVDQAIVDYLVEVIYNACLTDEFQEYVASQDSHSVPLCGDQLKAGIQECIDEYSKWPDSYLKGLL